MYASTSFMHDEDPFSYSKLPPLFDAYDFPELAALPAGLGHASWLVDDPESLASPIVGADSRHPILSISTLTTPSLLSAPSSPSSTSSFDAYTVCPTELLSPTVSESSTSIITSATTQPTYTPYSLSANAAVSNADVIKASKASHESASLRLWVEKVDASIAQSLEPAQPAPPRKKSAPKRSRKRASPPAPPLVKAASATDLFQALFEAERRASSQARRLCDQEIVLTRMLRRCQKNVMAA